MDREPPPKPKVKSIGNAGQGLPGNLDTLRRQRSQELFAAVEKQAIEAREAARLDKEKREKARRKARLSEVPESSIPKIDTSGIARAQQEARIKRELKKRLKAVADSGEAPVDVSSEVSSTQPIQIESFLVRKRTKDAVRDILMNTSPPEDDPEPPKSS